MGGPNIFTKQLHVPQQIVYLHNRNVSKRVLIKILIPLNQFSNVLLKELLPVFFLFLFFLLI